MPFGTFDVPSSIDPQCAYSNMALCRDALQPTIDSIANAIGNALNTQDQLLNKVYQRLKRYYTKQLKTQDLALGGVIGGLLTQISSAVGEQNVRLQHVISQIMTPKQSVVTKAAGGSGASVSTQTPNVSQPVAPPGIQQTPSPSAYSITIPAGQPVPIQRSFSPLGQVVDTIFGQTVVGITRNPDGSTTVNWHGEPQGVSNETQKTNIVPQSTGSKSQGSKTDTTSKPIAPVHQQTLPDASKSSGTMFVPILSGRDVKVVTLEEAGEQRDYAQITDTEIDVYPTSDTGEPLWSEPSDNPDDEPGETGDTEYASEELLPSERYDTSVFTSYPAPGGNVLVKRSALDVDSNTPKQERIRKQLDDSYFGSPKQPVSQQPGLPLSSLILSQQYVNPLAFLPLVDQPQNYDPFNGTGKPSPQQIYFLQQFIDLPINERSSVYDSLPDEGKYTLQAVSNWVQQQEQQKNQAVAPQEEGEEEEDPIAGGVSFVVSMPIEQFKSSGCKIPGKCS